MIWIKKLHGGQVFLLEVVVCVLALVLAFVLTGLTDSGETYFYWLVADMGVALTILVAIPWVWLSARR